MPNTPTTDGEKAARMGRAVEALIAEYRADARVSHDVIITLVDILDLPSLALANLYDAIKNA